MDKGGDKRRAAGTSWPGEVKDEDAGWPVQGGPQWAAHRKPINRPDWSASVQEGGEGEG